MWYATCYNCQTFDHIYHIYIFIFKLIVLHESDQLKPAGTWLKLVKAKENSLSNRNAATHVSFTPSAGKQMGVPQAL